MHYLLGSFLILLNCHPGSSYRTRIWRGIERRTGQVPGELQETLRLLRDLDRCRRLRKGAAVLPHGRSDGVRVAEGGQGAGEDLAGAAAHLDADRSVAHQRGGRSGTVLSSPKYNITVYSRNLLINV